MFGEWDFGLNEPIFDGLFILIGEFSVPVDVKVFFDGHIASIDFFPYFAESVFLFFLGVLIPLGEIDFMSAFRNIIGDIPRDGSDIGVPRPMCFVGVAIVAGAFEDLVNGGRGGEVFGDGGVVSFDGNELHRGEDDEDEDYETEQKFLHGRFRSGVCGVVLYMCGGI